LEVCRVRNWDEVRLGGKFLKFQEEGGYGDVSLSKWIYAVHVPKKTHMVV